jgi:hypothetical protein
MIRKLLLVAAAIAMPASAGAVGLVATASPAWAPPPDPTCTVTAVVHFPAPGLTKAGSVTNALTETTTTTGGVLGGAGCAGVLPNLAITAPTVLCPAASNPNPLCIADKHGYDSWANYVSSGTASILASLPNLNFKIGSTTYTTHNTAAAALLPNAAGCGTGLTGLGKEVGFKLTGKITTVGAYHNLTTTLKVCLGKVTGTNLVAAVAPAAVPTFLYQIGNAANLVKTAIIDPVHSSLTF